MFTLDGVDVWTLIMNDTDGQVRMPIRATHDEMSALIDEIGTHSQNDNVGVYFDPAITPMSIAEFRDEFAHMFEDR